MSDKEEERCDIDNQLNDAEEEREKRGGEERWIATIVQMNVSEYDGIFTTYKQLQTPSPPTTDLS